MILLINKNALLYADQYQLFTDPQAAIGAANDLGWGRSGWNIPVNLKPGFLNMYSGGDVDLALILLEPK